MCTIMRISIQPTHKHTLRHLTTYAWGNADFGQLGLPSTLLQDELDTYGKTVSTPHKIPSLSQYNLLNASISTTHSAFIRGDGMLLTCGSNTHGQLGLPTSSSLSTNSTTYYEPTPIPGLPSIQSVSLGGGHTLALSIYGEVYGFGDNRSGQVGIGNENMEVKCPQRVEVLIEGGHQIVWIATSEKSSAAVCTEGKVYTWGAGDHGELGHGTTGEWFGRMIENSPRLVRGLDGVKIVRVYAGGDRFIAIDKEGKAYGWGSADGFVMGTGKEGIYEEPIEVLMGIGKVKKVGLGMRHALILSENGAIWGVGVNDNGCVGVGEDKGDGVIDTPVRIKVGSGSDVDAGWGVSAIVCDGEIWTWGCGRAGALGVGDPVDFWIPRRLGVKGKAVSVGSAGLSMLAW